MSYHTQLGSARKAFQHDVKQAAAVLASLPSTKATPAVSTRVASAMKLAEFNDTEGTFIGYLATFNNVDLGNDVIEPGAFTNTIATAKQEAKARGSDVLWPILWQHDSSQPIGGILNAVEDTYGLKVWGQLDLSIPQGAAAYSGLKSGYLDSMSIGYDTVKERWVGGARHLLELQLWEGSIVTFPMNPQATISTVKGAGLGVAGVAPLIRRLHAEVMADAKRDREQQARDQAGELAAAYCKANPLPVWSSDRAYAQQYHQAFEVAFLQCLKRLEEEHARKMAALPQDTTTLIATLRKSRGDRRGDQARAIYRRYGIDMEAIAAKNRRGLAEDRRRGELPY